MKRTILIAIFALLFGLIAGWKARYFADDGHDDIQRDLNDAARRGRVDVMERLIAAGADPLKFKSFPNVTLSGANGTISGATPLIEAAYAGEPEAVEFLINRGAAVNLQESINGPITMAEIRLHETERTIQILRAHIKARSEGFTTKAITPSEQAAPSNGDKPSN